MPRMKTVKIYYVDVSTVPTSYIPEYMDMVKACLADKNNSPGETDLFIAVNEKMMQGEVGFFVKLWRKLFGVPKYITRLEIKQYMVEEENNSNNA